MINGLLAPWPLKRGLVEESARWYNLELLPMEVPK